MYKPYSDLVKEIERQLLTVKMEMIILDQYIQRLKENKENVES